jgi:hypothetical protein
VRIHSQLYLMNRSVELALTKTMPLTFSAALPAGCPLQNSTDCDGSVFVLVTNAAFNNSHFLSQAERGRANSATGDHACTRHGLSVFPDLHSCAHQRTLFPRLGPYIASAALTSEHGKLANTASSNNPLHQTWWRYQEVSCHALFTLVEE